jgi:hypothetical protein
LFAPPRPAQRNKNGFTNNSAAAGARLAFAGVVTLQVLPAHKFIGELEMKALPTKDWREFGKIIVSGDYQGDLNAIVNVLNSLQWSYYPRGEQYEWGIEQTVVYDPPSAHRREIIVLNGEVLYPSLRPIGDIFVLKDGRRCFADDADKSFIAQWEADKDKGALDWSEYTLGKLSALISPHLNKGAIEFVEVRAAGGMIDHERLLVRSDGSAEYHNCHSRNFIYFHSGTNTDSEYYEPESSKGARSRMHSRSRRPRVKSAVRQKVSR